MTVSAEPLCPRCGAAAAGRFCSQCGASLDDAAGSLGSEISSKFSGPITGTLSYAKAFWLLATSPRAFCRSWLLGPQGMAALAFPLSGAWSRVSRNQTITPPYRALAVAIGLIAAVGALEAGAVRVAGFDDLFKQAAAHQEAGIQQAAQHYYGHRMRIIALSNATGFAPLDSALVESWRLWQYLAFAVFVAWLMPRARVVQSQAVFQYFAYAVAAALTSQVLARAVAAVLFVPLAAGSLEAAVNVSTVVVFLFGYLPAIWFGALLPIVVFPGVLGVSRARVAAAVIGGLAIMGLINVIVTQAMLRSGLILT